MAPNVSERADISKQVKDLSQLQEEQSNRMIHIEEEFSAFRDNHVKMQKIVDALSHYDEGLHQIAGGNKVRGEVSDEEPELEVVRGDPKGKGKANPRTATKRKTEASLPPQTAEGITRRSEHIKGIKNAEAEKLQIQEDKEAEAEKKTLAATDIEVFDGPRVKTPINYTIPSEFDSDIAEGESEPPKPKTRKLRKKQGKGVSGNVQTPAAVVGQVEEDEAGESEAGKSQAGESEAGEPEAGDTEQEEEEQAGLLKAKRKSGPRKSVPQSFLDSDSEDGKTPVVDQTPSTMAAQSLNGVEAATQAFSPSQAQGSYLGGENADKILENRPYVFLPKEAFQIMHEEMEPLLKEMSKFTGGCALLLRVNETGCFIIPENSAIRGNVLRGWVRSANGKKFKANDGTRLSISGMVLKNVDIPSGPQKRRIHDSSDQAPAKKKKKKKGGKALTK